MANITTEYLSDLDLESLSVGTVMNCTKGVERGKDTSNLLNMRFRKSQLSQHKKKLKGAIVNWLTYQIGA